jgi:hypothetical protein
MSNLRPVKFKTLFTLVRSKGPLAIIGLVFTLVSLVFVLPIVIIVSSALKTPFEEYNFKEIEKNGIEKIAKITFVKTINNVSINNEHPQLISYEYENNGQRVSDKFETLDLEKTAGFSIGKEIKILVNQNQSIIKGLEPFSFPTELFFLFPFIFLLIGIPMLLVGLLPALRTFNLYKTGLVKDAYLVALDTNAIASAFRFNQSVLVHYYFLNEFGSKVFGKSTTSDLLMLKDKKAGDIVKVFVSENDENKSCLIPGPEAMKYNWSI